MRFATKTVLCAVLSVGLGWGGGCNTDRVICSPVCGVGEGWGLQQRLCYVGVVLSGGLGWGGVCNKDCVMCGPVWGGVGVVALQHGPFYVWSCLWGWGGVVIQTAVWSDM